MYTDRPLSFLQILDPTRSPLTSQSVFSTVAVMKLAVAFVLLSGAACALGTMPFYPREHPDIRPKNKYGNNLLM